MESKVRELFPFESFRGKQEKITQVCAKALFEDGYNTVVLDAPVGIGKSAINMTLLRMMEDGFYTTPSKSLREQLQNDDVLNEYIRSLRARRDYICGITKNNCEDCHINQSSEQSCSEQGSKCTYWANKMAAINSNISVLTFSYLIIDNLIPPTVNDTPISFEDREGIVVDEAHGLVEQTSSMHAGMKVSPFSLPNAVYSGSIYSASMDANSYFDVKDEIDRIYKRCSEYIRDDVDTFEMEPAEKSCENMMRKIDWMRDEIGRGNHWVVDVERQMYKGNSVKTLELRPINVSSFLKNNVWSRANKRIISTATLPYRNNPEIWLRKVGLDPEKTKIISVGMPFPVENRPIYTDSMVCSMSSGGDRDNWSDIMDKINSLAENHYQQKGLIHTSSYSRAEDILDSIKTSEHPYLDNNVMLHDKMKDNEKQIQKWQDSDKDIFLSPSMMEGVDLKDDMCRWQVLLKVPYPSMDSRVEYILNETKYGWNEYFEQALIRVVQSYGRGIRSKDDYCNYYVLDKDFNKLMKKRTPPKWFKEAISDEKPEEKSLFDY